MALALVLFGATVSYLAAFPLAYHSPDEPHMLHEAKRVLAGEVMYRDVFDLTTPGWQYLMAALFWLFGTTLRTARMATAVMHGLTTVLVSIACRRLGVRRPLAWAAGLAYLVVAQPALPVASYHWLGTSLSVLLLVMCIEMRGRAGWIFAAGVVVGLLVAVHQQRGLSLGVGVALIVAADAWLSRRAGASRGWAPLVCQVMILVAGTLLVVVPVGLVLVTRAGIEPVWHAVVVFPLFNYRAANRIRWGGWLFGTPPATIFPRLLTYAPAVLVPSVGFLVARWRRAGDVGSLRLAIVLTSFAVFSILSIAYYPDLIHIALIVPVFLVVLAGGLEWTLSALPERLDRLVGWTASVAIAVACAWQLDRNLPRPATWFVSTYDSAFGPIQMNGRTAQLYGQLDALLQHVPSRTFFRYPFSQETYLILGAHNPTRFEFILSRYHSREHKEEVIAALRAADVPYVMVDQALLTADDPIYRFIQEHYEPLTDADALTGVVWRRKAPGG
ncbi:MAG: hypothetical protein ACRDUX_18195 [Mycobacterium sp.]